MTHLRRAREEAQEQTQPVSEYWLPQPFEYADPKAGRAFVDPVYDPFTKTVRPWGDFFWPKKDLDERHKLKRPDWEHPGDWYDEGYVEELEALLLKEPPRAYVRNPEEIDLRPIKKLKKYAPKGRKGLDNILSVLEKAEPEEIDYWRHWYGYAHLEAVKLSERHNRPVDLCAGVIAVLSPKELWETNLYLADRALAMDWDEVKAMDTNRAKAYSLVVENDFSVIGGGKVFDFFLSVADPVAFQERVVVDTHAINIWRGIREGEAPQISKKERQRLAADYAEAGRISSLSPQAIQAITWVLWRQYPSEKGTAPIETEELPETWGKGQFEDFYQPGEEEHPDIAEYYGLGDLPEGEFVEPIEPTEHWYGKYGQLAEPIRDVVGYRCLHCKESIHEKFGSSWDEESDAHVCNKCGGKFHYKTEEERATEREALERLFPSMRMARAAGVTVEPKRPSMIFRTARLLTLFPRC